MGGGEVVALWCWGSEKLFLGIAGIWLGEWVVVAVAEEGGGLFYG